MASLSSSSLSAVKTEQDQYLCEECAMSRHEDGLDPALMKAAETRHSECVNILLEAGADVNKPDADNDTPLHKASVFCHHSCIESLIKARADVNRRGVNDLTALCLATRDIQCVETLIKSGADVNQQATMSGWTPLIWALASGNDLHITSDVLLENRADINKGDYDGCTPLMHVVQNKDNDIAYVLKAGADVNKRDSYNRTALHYAAHLGFDHFVCNLIEAGADVNVQDAYGDTALLHVSSGLTGSDYEGHDKCIPPLVEAAADVNITNSGGYTALLYVCEAACIQSIKLLVNSGADVNAVNIEGDTVFHMILRSSKYNNPNAELFEPVKSVKYLLRIGAKIYVSVAVVGGLTALNKHVKHLPDTDVARNVVRVLFAAGETITDAADVPDYLHPPELCLKHLCREAVRKHLVQMAPHQHLFNRIPQIHLPSYITQYLMYYESLDDDCDDNDSADRTGS